MHTRSGTTLHFEGYIYTKIRDGANGFQFWRCQNGKAGYLARTTSEGSRVVNNHPPNAAQTTTQLALVGIDHGGVDHIRIDLVYTHLATLSLSEREAHKTLCF